MTPPAAHRRAVPALLWGATALAVVIAVVLVVPAVSDSGGWAAVLLGVPVALCLVAVATVRTTWSRAVTWTAAAAVLVWSLVLGLGIGLVFLPVAALLAAAAARDVRR
ncbi:hypothetical protein [Blastococcus goldschmidtiae]|uniref:Uncharacterized protein n=1 Tax=Blastococcus goldschmidtiae TaxID=3075546 RepID=A0ABU2K4S3_9ACTN|nr:hypothetical protein [Blastococcus sp. DSM 46792]MDT0275174.1 hypothetical protein [Blastococcus sp. DSM 46792]